MEIVAGNSSNILNKHMINMYGSSHFRKILTTDNEAQIAKVKETNQGVKQS